MFFTLSADSAAELAAEARALADKAESSTEPLSSIATGFADTSGSQRAVVVASDRATLVRRLRAVAADEPGTGVAVGVATSPAEPVWVFSGHGSQWPGMGRALLAAEPAFAAEIDRLEPLIAAESGFSVRDAVSGTADGIAQVQPTLFAMQLALAAAWGAYGSAPAAVIGHSMGETAAAVVAGALSVEDGVTVICRRSRLMERVAGSGAMAMVALPGDVVEVELADVPEVTIAALSAPTSTVVAGTTDRVRALVDAWTARDLMARVVPVDVASHSPQVEPILADLGAELAGLRPRPSHVRVYSTALPDPRISPAFDASYWIDNLRHRVRFSTAVTAALADGHRLFVEISPHPLLAHALRENAELSGHPATVLSSIRRGSGSAVRFHTQLGALHCAGGQLNPSPSNGAGHSVTP